MTGGHHVLEVVASLRREMLDSVLSVRTLADLRLCSFCRTRAAKIFNGFLLRLGNGRVHDLVHRTIQCALLLCDLLHAERSDLS